ncbi:MAG TPA: hypothetical protein VLM85_23990 [Polyangiaceae bacterium]|nr:hypothetical protein [Polyangiaceae bacterium]
MDPEVHKRYLSYRETFAYFAQKGQQPLDAAAFTAADAEQRALEAAGAARSDEEEARFVELTILLFRD